MKPNCVDFVNTGRQPVVVDYNPEVIRSSIGNVAPHTTVMHRGYSVVQPVEPAEPDKPIGYGAFGVVWAVTDPRDGRRLALKKIVNVFNSLYHCRRIFRELSMLASFNHTNLLCLVDIVHPEPTEVFNEIHILTELMQSDLQKIISSSQTLTSDHVKVFLYQILRGLKYLHSAGVLHRDIKPGNLLVNSNCCLKIGDFGLARFHEPDEEAAMTQVVVTQYYRAPEILMGVHHYDFAIDVWSVGCIFAELLGRKVLFEAPGPIQQLDMIIQLLGTPDTSDMEGASEGALRHVLRQPPVPSNLPSLLHLSYLASPEAVHLLTQMLIFNPKKRVTAAEALSHPYLDEGRARFHGCMCECCVTPFGGCRQFCPPQELEPICRLPFDDSFEKSLTSVRRVQDMMLRFMKRQTQQRQQPPLRLNPNAACYRVYQNSVSVRRTDLVPVPLFPPVSVLPVTAAAPLVPTLPFGC
ncbi:serine/threonine-protein kinase NLK2-like [Babylonia areolata]|uniref:serine/threonine-protein kinase NLK2-like n=1 Tax=Babylonia areolata TaxID=304850 RepID=UPI003FD2F282